MNKVLFLPKDYQAPKTSNFYMKLQDGENKFRILTQPILGWEDWLDKKPIRFHFHEKPLKSFDPKKPVKHFWSMVVWNYAEEEIQILHITQASIRSSIEALSNDSDWGAPYFYDLKIIKKGEGMETEYVVNPLPHKKLMPHIIERFSERPCNLDALFENSDPFSKEQGIFTPGIFSEKDIHNDDFASKTISETQAQELENILGECGENYKSLILKTIKKKFGSNKLSEIPSEEYEKVKMAATKMMEETHAKQVANFKQPELAEAAQ